MSMRCYNCFKEIGTKSVCPHCGYEQDTPADENQLKPGTLITGRYLIGRARGSDENGVIYNVFDLKTESKRRMREYFPEEHCTRGADGEVQVKPGHENEFKRQLQSLKLNSVGEDGEKKYTYIDFNGTGYFIERKKKAVQQSDAKHVSEDEEDEKLLGGKLPAIIIGAVALIALIVAGILIFKPENDDTTNEGTKIAQATATVVAPTSNATDSISFWDVGTPTPVPYNYSEPTASITNSYSQWMADPGSHDQVIVTSVPGTPTPTPYNMWDDLERDVYGRATPTPTPSPQRKTINSRSSVEDITELQWQLIELGWLDAAYPSGVYDNATVDAVKAFQTYMNTTQNAHLTVDGICGPQTFRYLDNYSIAIKPTTSPVYTVTPAPTANVIDKNSSPLEIRNVQLKLMGQGWYTGEANGVYDYETMNSVIRFQTYVNNIYGVHYLDVTGYVDQNTMTMLDSGWFPAPAEPTAEPETTPTTAPTADPMDETDKLILLDEPVDVKIIATPNAYVYERASINAGIIASAPNGAVFSMLAKSDSWALLTNHQDAN
ncbi:MAG: peptidoglycan-binding protein, partial [Clostridia bacterium]|nr:peptidoglycan-binding protein [Clostridia bacterium]